MRDDPFSSKIAIKAPLTDASTASDVIMDAVARHARVHEHEQSKKRVLGKRADRYPRNPVLDLNTVKIFGF